MTDTIGEGDIFKLKFSNEMFMFVSWCSEGKCFDAYPLRKDGTPNKKRTKHLWFEECVKVIREDPRI